MSPIRDTRFAWVYSYPVRYEQVFRAASQIEVTAHLQQLSTAGLLTALPTAGSLPGNGAVHSDLGLHTSTYLLKAVLTDRGSVKLSTKANHLS